MPVAPPSPRKAESEHATVVVARSGVATKSVTALRKELRVTLTIVDQDDSRICCKSDGLRFSGGSETTVKLCSNMVYRLQLTSSPAVVFRGPARIRTRRAECYEPSFLDTCCGCLPGMGSRKYLNMNDDMDWQEPVAVPLTLPAATAANGSPAASPAASNLLEGSGRATPPPAAGSRAVAEAQWMCAMELTGRGTRGELEVELDVEDYGRLSLPLQAKVYALGDHSAKHGVALHAVEYLLYKHSITGNIKVLTTQYQR